MGAEAGQVGLLRPQIRADKPPPGQQQRVIRSALAFDEERFVQVTLLVVVDVGRADRVAAHYHVAVDVIVELQRELLVHRQLVKPARLGEGALEQRERHVVPGQHEKADRGQRVMHLPRDGLERTGPTGQVIGNIDDRDRLAHAPLPLHRETPQSSRCTRFSATVSSSMSSLSNFIGHWPSAKALSAILPGCQAPSLSTRTLVPAWHLPTGLPGPSIDQASAFSGGKVTSSSPPSILATQSPDLPGLRTVAACQDSSFNTKNRAPGMHSAFPDALAAAAAGGADAVTGLAMVPA